MTHPVIKLSDSSEIAGYWQEKPEVRGNEELLWEKYLY